MEEVEILVTGLFVAVAVLAAVARSLRVPYPIALVVGGLVIGLIPGLPRVELEPAIVLVIFLPPLLYAGAYTASLRDLRANLRVISLNAVGLVLFTMALVAVVAHAMIDGLPWAAAFALGAIVAPTDPVAATTIMRRLGAPRRLVAVLEGESLLNDASALVAYKIAVAAAVGGSFSAGEAVGKFVLAAAGGVAIGLVVGVAITEVRRRLNDVTIEVTVSLLTGYAAYVPAERAGVSGVLAVVTAGVYIGWRAPQITAAATRLTASSVWEILNFLLNATLFLLVGLQLGLILDGGLGDHSTGALLAYGATAAGVVIGARFVWAQLMTMAIRTLDRRPSQVARRASWRVRVLTGWAGMRGAVSLAAALALPSTIDGGAAFPERDLIIYVTFAVIVVTVVGQGLTLPLLIRALGIRDDGGDRDEELRARMVSARAAVSAVEELEREEWTRDDTIERMRGLYTYRMRRFKAQAGKIDGTDGIEERSSNYQRMVHTVIAAQREALVRLRNEGTISNDVMRRVERELDLEEDRLEI